MEFLGQGLDLSCSHKLIYSRTGSTEPGWGSNLRPSTPKPLPITLHHSRSSKTFFFGFLDPCPQHMEVPRLGVGQSYSCQPTPQPQQHEIQATSATYITAHSNTGSPTHWARSGIEPASLWILVGFVSTEPWWELPKHFLSRCFIDLPFRLSALLAPVTIKAYAEHQLGTHWV